MKQPPYLLSDDGHFFLHMNFRNVTITKAYISKYRTVTQIVCNILINMIYYFIFSGSAAQHGLWPPCSRGFLITRNDAPQSVGLQWTSDQLVAETST
jgi:hypothetical protein